MATNKTITLVLNKSSIGCNPTQRAALKGLGLKKRHQEVTLSNLPALRGMVKKVIHLVGIVSQK